MCACVSVREGVCLFRKLRSCGLARSSGAAAVNVYIPETMKPLETSPPKKNPLSAFSLLSPFVSPLKWLLAVVKCIITLSGIQIYQVSFWSLYCKTLEKNNSMKLEICLPQIIHTNYEQSANIKDAHTDSVKNLFNSVSCLCMNTNKSCDCLNN